MIVVSKDHIRKGIMLTISYAFVMSISVVGAKQAQIMISVPTMLFWQSALGFLAAIPPMRGEWKPIPAKICVILFFRSLSGFAALLFYYFAINHIPIVDATLLRTCAPLCVPFVVWAVYKRAIPPARWLPLMIGFVGTAFIIRPTSSDINIWHIVGFCSAIGLAVSMVTTRLLSNHISSNTALLAYYGFSSIASLLMVLVSGESLFIPVAAWAWILLVAACLYLGLYQYTRAYTYAPASIVSPVSYIGVVFSGFWGWLVWGHIPDLYAWIGICIIFFSIVLSARIKAS